MYIKKKEYQWYAVYTNPRSEKRVAESLTEEKIECYIPMQKRLKQWSDRKKIVEEPLIRSYVFVRISPLEYYKVLQTQHIVRFVAFGGEAATIPDQQIDNLKLIFNLNIEADSTQEKIEPGDPVRVYSGPLLGLQGELVNYKGKKKVIVRIDHIGFSIMVEFPITIIRLKKS